MRRHFKSQIAKFDLGCVVLLVFAALLPCYALAASHPIPGLYNPVANPRAEVVVGHARFTVLTPRLIRMEWVADGKFENHASFVFLNRNLPVPPFTHHLQTTADGEKLILKTASLTLVYTPASGSDGRFTSDNLQVSLTVAGKPSTWRPGMPDTGNLQGTTRTLDGLEGDKIHGTMGPGLISRNGWVLVDDSTRPLFDSDNFSFSNGEQSPWPWVMLRPPGTRQDWYFFGYGHHYKEALGDFVKVAGRIPLPPRFAFGDWWSRYWAYSDQGLNKLVQGFHENDTPLSVLVIDMNWHQSDHRPSWDGGKLDASGHTYKWGGYTWDPLLFPDPTAFLHKLHQEGLKVTLNLHPASGVQPWEARYSQMARAMGINPATKQYVPFDITSKKFATNYFNIILHPLEKQGVNFWWLDWQQENHTALPGVSPTWWLGYVFFSDQAREGKRPLLMNRWGGLGDHRYQIGFSGDVHSSWPSLAFETWFTATAANVGFAYWSHDIGGHIPGTVSPELYTRWIQFGVFSPILRTHTTKNPKAERRIWAYPEPYSGIMRQDFQLRNALIPYIYTEARRTYDTGVAFLRPLYYNWPNANAAYSAKHEYTFGSEMLVAPVTSPVNPDTQLATEKIWLPRGSWIEWPTGRHFTGPVQLTRQFTLSQIPVYVRPGAIVPMAPPMSYPGQKPLDPLILTIFPQAPGSSSHYRLYQDAGDTRAYQSGQAAWTEIEAHQQAGDLVVKIGPEQGSYPGMQTSRSYQLRLPDDWPPDSVTVDGKPLDYRPDGNGVGWRFVGNTLTTVITLPSSSVKHVVEVRVRRSAAHMAHLAELDGFAGMMTRLRAAYNAMNQTLPLGAPPQSLIDAMQTGDRLSYYPQNVDRELEHFRAILPQARADVAAMKAAVPTEVQTNIEKTDPKLWQTYQSNVGIAVAQMNSMNQGGA